MLRWAVRGRGLKWKMGKEPVPSALHGVLRARAAACECCAPIGWWFVYPEEGPPPEICVTSSSIRIVEGEGGKERFFRAWPRVKK